MTKHSTLAIKGSSSLLIYTITTLHVRTSDRDSRTLIEEQIKDILEGIHREIVRWIHRKFGNRFGSPGGMPILSCAGEELEVCVEIDFT